MLAYYKQNNLFRKVEEFREFDNPEQECANVNSKIRKAEPLSDEERQLRDSLLQKGFPDWKRADFHAYIKITEQVGRKNVKKIVDFFKDRDKDADEVMAYHETFCQRYKEIEGWERYIMQIEKGEAKLQRKQNIRDSLHKKVKMYQAPLKG